MRTKCEVMLSEVDMARVDRCRGTQTRGEFIAESLEYRLSLDDNGETDYLAIVRSALMASIADYAEERDQARSRIVELEATIVDLIGAAETEKP